ncbi:hypothetical protein R20943_01082 [Paraburkholderia aspalathi]|nr:hypothetical protein R20943_01082 [Paraburkholderia aspalathi]
MRLGGTAIRCSAGIVHVCMAILLLAAVTVPPANAKSPSFPGRNEKTASSSGVNGSKLKVPTAERKLLGAPSDLDSGYLEQLGGPADDSATPALSLTEEPTTPTEVLLAKGTGRGVTSSAANRTSVVHTLPLTSGTALTNTDLASHDVVTNPYISPAGGAAVYRSPW